MKNTHPKRTYIFDCNNIARSVELKPVAIIAISVTILSGDETIDVYYEDGTVEYFDSSDDRIEDHFDGNYVVLGDKLKEWYKFTKFLERLYISYARKEEFTK